MNVPKLSGGPGRFHQSDYLIGRYAAKVPTGTTIEEILHPEYWQNHQSSLRPGMVVNVLSDDSSLDCDLRVLTVTKTTTRMRVIRHFEGHETPVLKAEVSGITTNWGGPKHKWRFLHAGDVIEFGFSSEPEAEEAGRKYLEGL